MPVAGIKRTRIIVSLPEATYESAKILADQEGITVHKYVKSLVEREIIKINLPLYYSNAALKGSTE